MDERRPAIDIARLVDEHYALLYRVAFRLTGSSGDAEDLVQQTFLTVQAKRDQLREPEKARSWLCRILRNHFLQQVRSRPAARVVSLERVSEPVIEPAADIPIDSEELQNLLDRMPEEYRTPLILFYFEEFSYREIAEQMDVPLGTVMSRLARGKTYLRQRLTAPQPASS